MLLIWFALVSVVHIFSYKNNFPCGLCLSFLFQNESNKFQNQNEENEEEAAAAAKRETQI